MSAALSLIPELEEVVQRGSRAKRVEALQRITALFLDGASRYEDEHVDLFDAVFVLLIEEIETRARAELAKHLAPIGNAPLRVLGKLARDDDIAVAGPVLKLAPRLTEVDLVDVASKKSQAHLHAISARAALGEAVTDVLVRGVIAMLPVALPTIVARAFPTMASPISSSAPRRTASWPRRWRCDRIFRRRCFATS